MENLLLLVDHPTTRRELFEDREILESALAEGAEGADRGGGGGGGGGQIEEDIKNDPRKKKEEDEGDEGDEGDEEDEEDDEELTRLGAAISRGKEVLMRDLRERRELVAAEAVLSEYAVETARICGEGARLMDNVAELTRRLGANVAGPTSVDEEMQGELDAVLYGLVRVADKAKAVAGDELEAVRAKTKANADRIKKMGSTYGILRDAQLGHPCPVCLSRQVDIFCSPCGHSFCSACMRVRHCYICRASVDRTFPLYFS